MEAPLLEARGCTNVSPHGSGKSLPTFPPTPENAVFSTCESASSCSHIFPRREGYTYPFWGAVSTLAAAPGCSHQPSHEVLNSLDTRGCPKPSWTVDLELRETDVSSQHNTQCPQTYSGEQMEDRVLTFRGSPLFGLQGREGAHDGPHGSEDLCETWDPRPCLFPPLKRNRRGLPTLNWRRGKPGKQKKPRAARLQLGIQKAWGRGAWSLWLLSSLVRHMH